MISGIIIKKVRAELGMTQPEFAKLLSKQSGEFIDPKALCRMENYKQQDACHSIPPSPAVEAAVYSLSSCQQKK